MQARDLSSHPSTYPQDYSQVDFGKVAHYLSQISCLKWEFVKIYDVVTLRARLNGCNLDIMCCQGYANRREAVSAAINLQPTIEGMGMVPLYKFMKQSYDGFKTECNTSVTRGEKAIAKIIYLKILKGLLPEFTRLLGEHMDSIKRRETLVNEADANCKEFARILNVKPCIVRDKRIHRDYAGYLKAPSLGVEELGFGSSSTTLEAKAVLSLSPDKMQRVLELLVNLE